MMRQKKRKVYKAYRLTANAELEIVENSWLWDIDEDFLRKEEYIERAKKLTEKINQEKGTNYSWDEIFPAPEWEGWCYCTRCNEYFWQGEECSCLKEERERAEGWMD